jgi:tetratricopeptide (TPR) repeat protein
MSERSPGHDLNRRFKLLRPLGRGGMAEVWLVYDRELDEEVAAKIVDADVDPELLARLQREFRAARRLGHPNIVPVFDFHRGDRQHLLTMAHVSGEDLSSLRGAPVERILHTLVPIADALAHAHARGVVHRDLKATNVLVDAEGRPQLLDFGIAGLLDEDEPATTHGGGSRYNVSPQQLDGHPAGAADDLYAFGVLLYELVSGAPPFWPDVTPERVRSENPPPMKSSRPLPAELRALVDSLLAKSPANRPAEIGDVRLALERLLEQPEARLEHGTAKDVRLVPPPRARPVRPIPRPGDPGPVVMPARAGRRRALRGFFIAAAIAFVLFSIFFLFPWLSERNEEKVASVAEPLADESAAPDRTDQPSPPTPPSRADQNAAAARREARDLMQRALPLRRTLGERGVESWGGEALAAVEHDLARGDEAMGAADYYSARDAYIEALRGLETLDSLALDRLENALRDGSQALSGWDASGATDAFELALLIDPDNEIARRGHRRAQNLDEVRRLLQEGAAAESAARLEEAARLYSRAAALDPLSLEAQQASARVAAQVSDERFAEAMSRGLAELKQANYPLARESFERALAMRPDSAGAADGLAQLEAAENLDAIAHNRHEAIRLESEERWVEAAGHYSAVLELDPTVRFARDGEERTRTRAEMAARLDGYIRHSDRLSAQAVYNEADAVLAAARQVRPAGARHQEQLLQLERLLTSYATLTAVRIESDELTEVTVYRVGQLGTFKSRELQLRPGTYTVVGSRTGYRDVRHTLIVATDVPPEPLVVRCVEKL